MGEEVARAPLRLTEGETRALLASSLLVLLAALSRVLLQPPAAEVHASGLGEAGDVDSALAVAESAYTVQRRRAAPPARGERIDPNTANEAELDRLPGVGPALARAIVDSRREGGAFRNLGDLERVPGLGSNRIRRLAPYLALPVAAARGMPGSGYGEESGLGPRGPGRLNLNRASLEELEALPGIGPARARAIARWRREHGAFEVVEDLLEVPGIGPATLEQLRPLVVVGP